MGDKKVTSGSPIGELAATVVPATSSGLGEALAVAEVVDEAVPALAAVPGVAHDTLSLVEDLISKRLRAIRKKIKDADSIMAKAAEGKPINEDQKRKMDAKPSFNMVEEELVAILKKLPSVLSPEKLPLSAAHKEWKQSPPPAILADVKVPPPPGPDHGTDLSPASVSHSTPDLVPSLSSVEQVKVTPCTS